VRGPPRSAVLNDPGAAGRGTGMSRAKANSPNVVGRAGRDRRGRERSGAGSTLSEGCGSGEFAATSGSRASPVGPIRRRRRAQSARGLDGSVLVCSTCLRCRAGPRSTPPRWCTLASPTCTRRRRPEDKSRHSIRMIAGTRQHRPCTLSIAPCSRSVPCSTPG
jgi:hypothetical protein